MTIDLEGDECCCECVTPLTDANVVGVVVDKGGRRGATDEDDPTVVELWCRPCFGLPELSQTNVEP